MKNLIIFLSILFIVNSCQYTNKNTYIFNKLIREYYLKHSNEKKVIIDLKEVLPFEWDKLYIFNREHYPEANSSVVSEITGVNYYGNKQSITNRLILFIKGDEIVFDVLTEYKSDDFSKNYEPLQVNFGITKEYPSFFTNKNSKFIINHYYNDSSYLLTPVTTKH